MTVARRLAVAAWGLIVWAVATTVFRAVGEDLLSTGALWLVATFGAAIPLVAAVTFPVYRVLRVEAAALPLAAFLIAAPGMILDVFALAYHDAWYPNLEVRSVPIFGAWLLWAYLLIIATGVVRAPRVGGEG